VLSTDAVVHELYGSEELRDAVVARLGPGVAPDGTIDRTLIAGRVFANPDLREWLEGLLWPRVGARVAAWREEVLAAQPLPRAAVVEVPLLYEAGMEAGFDAVIAVVADEAVRRDRAARRGHGAITERTARQMTQEEKAQRADYVVVNDGSPEILEHRLSEILDKLTE